MFILLTFLLSTACANIDNVALCSSDIDCSLQWNNTLCLEVNVFGETTMKCTPDKPACRGASAGLCPSYQPPSMGYLNPQCIFENIEDAELAFDSAEVNLCSIGTSDASCFTSFEENNTTTIGRFRCVDAASCPRLSAFPNTCDECNTGGTSVCNDRGTCTHLSLLSSISKRGCLCYAGFGGARCDKIESDECEISCGHGGDCVDGSCVCMAPWKGDEQCTTCVSDAACENGGTCDVVTGTCACLDGFQGKTCGGAKHACVGVDCGEGQCIDGSCFCSRCVGSDCDLCADETCAECPASVATLVVVDFLYIALAGGLTMILL